MISSSSSSSGTRVRMDRVEVFFPFDQSVVAMTARPSGAGADVASTTSISAPVQNPISRRRVRTASRAVRRSHTRTKRGTPPDTSVTGGCTGGGSAVTGFNAGCARGLPQTAAAAHTARKTVRLFSMASKGE